MTTLINFNKARKIGVIYYPKKKLIRKFSLNKKNILLLKNEVKGIKWYFASPKNPNTNYLKNINKNSIDLKIVEGSHIKFWESIKKNEKYIENVVTHYKKVWPKEKNVPYHGDLTFSNIIFNKNNLPTIIDWENFSKNKKNWGFDLAYFLISTVALPSIFLNQKSIDKNELNLLSNIWRQTFKKSNYNYLVNPINFFRENYKKVFLLRNFNNYYPNILSNRKTNEIHETLNSSI